MTYAVPRSVVEAFYGAYASRDPDQIAVFLDENVEWNVYGPAEVMQVCGQWRGKAAVHDRWARAIPKVIASSRIERECLLVDGDHSALFGRVTSRQRPSGRIISHRIAHFATWRDNKVTLYRVINDTLDAVEQFIGHRIDLSVDMEACESDIVAI